MKFRFKKTPTGCVGAIDLPLDGPGKITAVAVGDDKADALGRAALIAERIASDPVMRALMPPQAAAAISAAKGLASAAKQGTKSLRRMWGRLKGPGKQRLAQVLHAEALDVETSDVGRYGRRKRRRRVDRGRGRGRRERDEDDDQGEPEAPPEPQATQPADQTPDNGDGEES